MNIKQKKIMEFLHFNMWYYRKTIKCQCHCERQSEAPGLQNAHEVWSCPWSGSEFEKHELFNPMFLLQRPTFLERDLIAILRAGTWTTELGNQPVPSVGKLMASHQHVRDTVKETQCMWRLQDSIATSEVKYVPIIFPLKIKESFC